MANLRAAQKEMTRRRLLSMALDLFEKNGYTNTTIDEIAAAAGTTRVTFYAHFPGRDGVMRALLDELNEILERRVDLDGSTSPSLVDAVRAGTSSSLGTWLAARTTQWPQIKPYIAVATEAAAVDKDLAAALYVWWGEVILDIVTGLDAADRYPVAERHFRAHLAMALLDQANLDWIRRGEAESPLPLRTAVLTSGWMGLIGRRES